MLYDMIQHESIGYTVFDYKFVCFVSYLYEKNYCWARGLDENRSK